MTDFTASKFMGVVSLAGPTWDEEFPVDLLAGRIAFYEGMVSRYSKKTSAYEKIVSALKSVS